MRREDAELRRIARVKHVDRPATQLLGPEMVSFFKQSIEKRHTRLGKIAECWAKLIPETLLDHGALESYNRGTLTVIVDSSSHLYELKQLLLAGLEDQLLLACKSAGLRKINLKPGRWYNGDSNDRKLSF